MRPAKPIRPARHWSGPLEDLAALEPSGLVALLAAVLFLAAGCGGRPAKSVAPGAKLPPQVEAVFPEARSTRALFDTPIWAQFAEPLDPSTVNVQTVFLKLDTRRIPCTVRWDAPSRRITIALGAELELNRTYSVELGPDIRAADGTPLMVTYFWQFTTLSVAFPDDPAPATGMTGEGPHAPLLWTGTDPGAGEIVYSIYAGSDSMLVAGRAGSPLATTRHAQWWPDRSWPLGNTVYWTVTAENRSAGESVDGPVWKFDVLAPGPLDSVSLAPQEWGGGFYGFPDYNYCNTAGGSSGPLRIFAMRWPVALLSPDLRVAGAKLEIEVLGSSADEIPGGAVLWAAAPPWQPCQVTFPGPPFPNQAVGQVAAASVIDATRLRYEGARLAAILQGIAQYGGEAGYLLNSTADLDYAVHAGPGRDAQLTFYYYRSGALAHGPRALQGR